MTINKEQRKKAVMVSLTEEEKKLLVEASKIQGLPLAIFLRFEALEKARQLREVQNEKTI